MEFIKKILRRKEFKIKGYILRFVEEENSWHVLKGHSIMFLGNEMDCRKYLNAQKGVESNDAPLTKLFNGLV